MKKGLIKVLILLLGLVLTFTPIGIFALATKNLSHIYSKTYYAALVDKVNYLKSVKDEKKIILIGGSNVAFGFNSELLENEFPEYKVVNFGLYAMLGTKIMMELALDYIGQDDMVFIIPEINSQSTSLYFNSESTLKAIEDDMSLLRSLDFNDKIDICLNYISFIVNKIGENKFIEPQGAYQRKNFNKYGDIEFLEEDDKGIPFRARNRMTLHYDPTMMVDYSYTIEQQFFDYLNDYSNAVNSKNAKLFYSFSPVNCKAVLNINGIPSDYYWNIRRHLSFQTIGNPSEYIIDPHYFYDSNFHLNDSGAVYRTYLFAQDIYRDIKVSSKSPSFIPPEPPPYVDDDDIGEDSETAPYFKYVEYDNSLIISGVANEHIGDNNLTLPSVANGKRVVGVGRNAFEECTSINDIIIPNSIKILMDGCFGNCDSLDRIYIETYNPSDIIVSYTGSMTENVKEGFKIYIHDECYESFASDYYWANYITYFERY